MHLFLSLLVGIKGSVSNSRLSDFEILSLPSFLSTLLLLIRSIQKPRMRSTVAVVILFLAVSLLVVTLGVNQADAQHHHFPMGECMCQEGGERGGHCHCPPGKPLPGKPCETRKGADGNGYIICFPFGR